MTLNHFETPPDYLETIGRPGRQPHNSKRDLASTVRLLPSPLPPFESAEANLRKGYNHHTFRTIISVIIDRPARVQNSADIGPDISSGGSIRGYRGEPTRERARIEVVIHDVYSVCPSVVGPTVGSFAF